MTRHSGMRRPTPPGLNLFLAALRWQESGSPKGNYREPNGQGAYQIIQSNWPAWAYSTIGYRTSDPDASHAPKRIQDSVAAAKVSEYYYGAGERNWRLVARIWNGGSPNPVPNPALGPGATTDTYASQLLAKQKAIATGGPIPKTVTAGTAPGDSTGTTGGCEHLVHFSVVFGRGPTLCLDKPLALVTMGAGGMLMLAGIGIVIVVGWKDTPAGRAAQGAVAALPVGRAVAVAASARPAARAARRETRAADSARRLAPVTAETRRGELHDQRIRDIEQRRIHRRLGGRSVEPDIPTNPYPPRRPRPHTTSRRPRPALTRSSTPYDPVNNPAPF